MAWFVFVLAVYCPDLGRGFVKDDFTWIRAAKNALAQPSRILVPSEPGFYRPLITTSFLLDYRIHRWRPRGYGWTNLGLYVACTFAVAALASAIGLPITAAIIAAFLWAVNPHGINMGVLWLSGRTSLCLTLFSIGAAWAFAQHKFVWGAVFIGCALGSKEEAVALPFVLLVWHWLFEDRRRVSVTALLCAVLPLAVYGVLRARTAAFTLTTAPSFYRLTADPTKRVALLASSWWVGMLAITIWLPVRSSLYAVGPSVGSALLGAALIDRLRSCTTVTRRVLVEPVLAALVVAAIPIYQMRDAPWVEGARVSQRTLTKVREDSPHLPHAGMIVLTDQEGETVSNFRNAFGDLSTEALQTVFDRKWDVVILDDPDAAPQNVIAHYRLQSGRIVELNRGM
ncbi:MAG: hypothetical protein DMF99_01050 [Acidobacteria bacterium]|nr:MAG: hypothetical protein DMF99_01050 [Acidobacteriota bacterium]